MLKFAICVVVIRKKVKEREYSFFSEKFSRNKNNNKD